MAEGSLLRRQLRDAVLKGGTVLREATGGMREGLQLLQEQPRERVRLNQLERELEEARRHGRWLSDDERAAHAAAGAADRQQRAVAWRQRRSLLVLLGISLLLPPFWPLALGLTAYLLFPQTTRRLTLVALVLAALGVVLLVAAVIAALVLLHA